MERTCCYNGQTMPKFSQQLCWVNRRKRIKLQVRLSKRDSIWINKYRKAGFASLAILGRFICVPTAAWPSDMVSNSEKGLQRAPCQHLSARLTGKARRTGGTSCRSCLMRAAPCSALPTSPTQQRPGLSVHLIKLHTQNYLNVAKPTVSTAQERCLESLERQISAEEFELWSCFTHIMLLSPTFTSICSLVVDSFPSNRMAKNPTRPKELTASY